MMVQLRRIPGIEEEIGTTKQTNYSVGNVFGKFFYFILKIWGQKNQPVVMPSKGVLESGIPIVPAIPDDCG